MIPTTQLKVLLNDHSDWLRKQYGCGYTVKQTSGNTLTDLGAEIAANHPVIVHVMWDLSKTPDNPLDPYYDIRKHTVGGIPHTMLAGGMDMQYITLLDPAWPFVANGSNNPTPTLHQMKLQDFWDAWSRPSTGNSYTPPNTMTVLILDPACALPTNTVIPTVTVSPTSTNATTVTPTNTPVPTKTPNPHPKGR